MTAVWDVVVVCTNWLHYPTSASPSLYKSRNYFMFLLLSTLIQPKLGCVQNSALHELQVHVALGCIIMLQLLQGDVEDVPTGTQCTLLYTALFCLYCDTGIFAIFALRYLKVIITAGFINGAIFNSNIVSIYGTTFVPGGITTNGAVTLVSFLTLNLGFETCLHDTINIDQLGNQCGATLC